MKKLSFAIMGLAIAGLMTFSSCKKPVSPIYNGGVNTVTFTATAGDGSKTIVNGTSITWNDGDQIVVNGTTLTLDEGAGTNQGTFTGEVAGTNYLATYKMDGNNGTSASFTIPATQTNTNINNMLPMAAYSSDRTLQFNTMVNILKLSLTGADGTKVNSFEITSSEVLSGTTNVTSTLSPSVPTGSGKTITVSPNTTVSATAKVYYVILPVFSADAELAIKFYGNNGDAMTVKVNTNGATTPGHLFTKAITVAYPEYLYFTVNKTTNKRVMFAETNLKWNGSNMIFAPSHAMENHWDENNVDLFCWNIDPEIARSLNGGTTFGDKLFTNVAGFKVQGGTADYWRTLTTAEWGVIFDREDLATANGVNRMCGCMKLGGIKGFVIIPDNYKSFGNGPEVTIQAGYIDADDSYDATTWAAMVAAGARFFPVTSCRNAAAINPDAMNFGGYWAGDPVPDGAGRMYFSPAGWGVNTSNNLNEGKAIRLVHDLN